MYQTAATTNQAALIATADHRSRMAWPATIAATASWCNTNQRVREDFALAAVELGGLSVKEFDSRGTRAASLGGAPPLRPSRSGRWANWLRTRGTISLMLRTALEALSSLRQARLETCPEAHEKE